MTVKRLGRYEIVALHAEGGMGQVYEAFDPQLKRKVALKTIRLGLGVPVTAVEMEERFHLEAHIAGRLSHPNIVSIFDAGRDEGLAYLVMEFVRGEDLKSLLRRETRLPLDRSLAIMQQLLAALTHAHERDIVHRDVKPSNILIEPDDKVKLGDFGAARIVDPDQTLTRGTMVGTLGYMSPEQVLGKPLDARCDQYAAGLVLYELLTGRRPFEEGGNYALMQSIETKPPPPPSLHEPRLPRRIDELLLKALAKNPDDRFATCREFATALLSAQQTAAGAPDAGAPVPAVAAPPVAHPPPAVDAAASQAPPPDPPGPGGPQRAPRAKVFAWLGGIAGGTLALATIAASGVVAAYLMLPEVAAVTDYGALKLPLRVLSADGVLLGEFGDERRVPTPIGRMPRLLQDAVLASEDPQFHGRTGADFIGLAWDGLTHPGRFSEHGAPIITARVAGRFDGSGPRTLARSIRELLLALKIERTLGKEQILEIYLNQVFLGQRAYGFGAASEAYFGKPLQDLGVAEAALLAGLAQAPEAHDPFVHPQAALQRQQQVIQRMLDSGYLAQEQADAARRQVLRYGTPARSAPHAQGVAELVLRLLQGQYGPETTTRGLNVTLTIDSSDQQAAHRALRRAVIAYEGRLAYRGPEGFVDLPADAQQLDARVAEALGPYPDDEELQVAVVLEAAPGRVVAMLRTGATITVSGDGLKPVAAGLSKSAGPQVRIRRGAVVRAYTGDTAQWTLTQRPEAEGALVSMDPGTGAIKALVGGVRFAAGSPNRVLESWRQPGSGLQPILYSSALEKGYTAQTVVNDAPLFFDAAATGGAPWEPRNFDQYFQGPMTLPQALAKSKNMVAIRVLQGIGVPFLRERIPLFGLDEGRMPADLTLATGAGAATPMQMAVAYSVFANGGHRVDPLLITRVSDSSGRILRETSLQPVDESKRVISARNAFVTTQFLKEATRSGAAAVRGAFKRNDLFGMVGMTADARDAWFAGYQPRLAAVVWIGLDRPPQAGEVDGGGSPALPAWIDYMAHALRRLPVREIAAPNGVVYQGGQWFFEEFRADSGVRSMGMEDKLPQEPSPEDRKSILDLFRR